MCTQRVLYKCKLLRSGAPRADPVKNTRSREHLCAAPEQDIYFEPTKTLNSKAQGARYKPRQNAAFERTECWLASHTRGILLEVTPNMGSDDGYFAIPATSIYDYIHIYINIYIYIICRTRKTKLKENTCAKKSLINQRKAMILRGLAKVDQEMDFINLV